MIAASSAGLSTEQTTIAASSAGLSTEQTLIAASSAGLSSKQTMIAASSAGLLTEQTTIPLSSAGLSTETTTQVFSTRIMPSTMESSRRTRFTSTRFVQTTQAHTTTFIPLNSMPMMTDLLRFTTQDTDPWANHRERFRQTVMTTRGKPRSKHYKI